MKTQLRQLTEVQKKQSLPVS